MNLNYRELSYNKKNNNKIGNFESPENRHKEIVDGLLHEIQEKLAKEHEKLIHEVRTGVKEVAVLEQILEEYVGESKVNNREGFTIKKLVTDIVNILVRWERIQPLIEDNTVTDIFTNEDLEVIKRSNGEDILTNISFRTDDELEQFIKTIALRTGDKINRDKCIMDAFDIVNNVRINAGIYGSATRKGEVVSKPYFVLRKYLAKDYTSEQFIENGTFSKEIHEFYLKNVEEATIMVVGAPEAGKSTHLDYLQSLKKPMRRLIKIEEEAELPKRGKNSVSFEARKVGAEETRYKYDMAEFAKIATRLSGKDVIIGEVRGREAWYLFRLLDMGYKGIYSVHGGSCIGGIDQTAFLMSLETNNLTYTQIMKKICNSVDLVVFVSQKKVVDIAEIIDYDTEKEEPVLNYVFRLKVNTEGHFYYEQQDLSDKYKHQLILNKKLRERRI